MLTHIKDIECPTCKNKEIVSDTRENKHSSGEWNEKRVFRCGCVLHYSPNFRNVGVSNECPKSEKNLKFKETLEKTKANLDKVIEDSELPKEFKERIKTYGWRYLKEY